MSGASAFGYFVFWLARASEPLKCTTRACGSGVRALAQLSGRGTMVTLSSKYAADRCAELSPFQGLAFGYFVLGMLSRQG